MDNFLAYKYTVVRSGVKRVACKGRGLFKRFYSVLSQKVGRRSCLNIYILTKVGQLIQANGITLFLPN